MSDYYAHEPYGVHVGDVVRWNAGSYYGPAVEARGVARSVERDVVEIEPEGGGDVVLMAPHSLIVVSRGVADMSATLAPMAMNTHERAKAANAALTTEQRSAAGKARAAALHSMLSLIDRACKKWPEATAEEKKAARAKLRAAGIIA